MIERVDATLLDPASTPPATHLEPAVTLNLAVLEDPLPTYISPITRVVNAALGLFGDAPDPRRRLNAVARSVRLPGQLEHVRIQPGPAPRTLCVTAVLSDSVPAASASSDETSRLDQLLQGAKLPAGFAQRADTLLQRVDEAAATERLTVAHPTLATDYAPMKYDYMKGYLWMFVMGSIGIAITFAFRRIEARGLIHKRGVEEAGQS